MRTKKLIPIIIALLLSLLTFPLLGQGVYADDGVSFEKDLYEFDISTDSGGSITASEEIETWAIADKSIIDAYYEGTDLMEFYIVGVGSTTVTATAYDGSIATCTVTVGTPDIVIPQKSITCNITEDYVSFDITSGYGLTFTSSNTSIVKIDSDSYDACCYFVPVTPGTAEITVKDAAGKSQTVSVTVTEAEWHLEKTSIQGVLSDEDHTITINGYDDDLNYNVKSSNEKVATAEVDWEGLTIYYMGPGTATITITDNYGKSETCKVTVKANPLKLNKTSLKFDKYDADYYEYDEDYLLYHSGEGNNTVSTVKSSNSYVVAVKKVEDEFSDDYEDGITHYNASVTPKGPGSATITVTDQFGQTVTIPVTVTQRYIDESKYLEDLEDTYISDLEYGDTKIYVTCDIIPHVYTTINGKKYTGSVNEEGDYVISHLPKLPAGSKITVYVTKGEAQYKKTIKVAKKDGRHLTAKVKSQAYTGKRLKPKVTIKRGKNVLKKGTDYTVKYSNNKKIGRAKATITFKGNYRGQKAAYFNITPKGTSIEKVYPHKDSFTVKWKKRTKNVTGYQIRYGLYKDVNYGGYTDIITVNNNKTTSKKITGEVYGGEKYYVWVRTFKKVGSKKYYSAWSKVKSVKVKIYM